MRLGTSPTAHQWPLPLARPEWENFSLYPESRACFHLSPDPQAGNQDKSLHWAHFHCTSPPRPPPPSRHWGHSHLHRKSPNSCPSRAPPLVEEICNGQMKKEILRRKCQRLTSARRKALEDPGGGGVDWEGSVAQAWWEACSRQREEQLQRWEGRKMWGDMRIKQCVNMGTEKP